VLARCCAARCDPRQIGGKRVDGVGREQMRVGAVLKEVGEEKVKRHFVRQKTAQRRWLLQPTHCFMRMQMTINSQL
jgi:hypothetical protein